jgi:hypothetical protein
MAVWLNVEIAGTAAWPKQEMEVAFEGHTVLLRPATKTTQQSVHIELCGGFDDIQALTLINRFLSLVCWCDDQPLENKYGYSGSPVPVSMPTTREATGSSIAYPDHFTLPTDPRAVLALALYREGRTINSTPFAFLSYFKILNIFWPDKFRTVNGIRTNPILTGITATLPLLKDEQAVSRVKDLMRVGLDVGNYLYESCRCAVAHANTHPIADPDNLADIRRLAADVCVVKSIAEHLMESELLLSRRFF